MKLIILGEKLINLDKIIYIDMEENIIYMEERKEITLQKDQLDEFVTKYNMYDTNETAFLVEKLSKLFMATPELLSRKGLIDQIKLMVMAKDKKKLLKELTENKKLAECSTLELVSIYKEILASIEKDEGDLPF